MKLSCMACLIQAPAVQLAEHAKAILEDDAKVYAGMILRWNGSLAGSGRVTVFLGKRYFLGFSYISTQNSLWCLYHESAPTLNILQPRQRKLSALLLQKACGLR